MVGRELARIGEVVGGKYRLDHVIGSGGMGLVVAATHLQLKSRVAIKFLFVHGKAGEAPLTRSLNEARAAAAIRSVHGVRVFDVGLCADGVPFIVMELLEGETLAALLGRTGALTVAESVDSVVEAAEALAEAHANGVAHRDLKPSNLFLARDGEGERSIRVLDFGIAKSFEDGDPSTRGAANDGFVGSPPYMSPEQLTDPGNVDVRTDVWSLAVVLYECLTAVSPFAAPSVGEICARILQQPPEPIGAWRAEVPSTIGELISRCLTRSKERRPSSMLELARALAPFGTGRSARSLRVMELAHETRGGAAAIVTPPAVGSHFEPRKTTDTLDTASALDTATWPHEGTNRAQARAWWRLALAGAGVLGAGLLLLSLRAPFAFRIKPEPSHGAARTAKQRPRVAFAPVTVTSAKAEAPPSTPKLAPAAIRPPGSAAPAVRRKPRAPTPSNPDDPEWIYLDRK